MSYVCTMQLRGHASNHHVLDTMASKRLKDPRRIERRAEVGQLVSAGRAHGRYDARDRAGGSARR